MTTPAAHPDDRYLPGLEPPDPPTEGELRLADALARVTEHADPEWHVAALQVVYRLASSHPALTTDQVWAELRTTGATTPEPRALGSIMRQAARARLIGPTDRYVPSERPEAHRRPVKVWRSLVYAGWGGGSRG